MTDGPAEGPGSQRPQGWGDLSPQPDGTPSSWPAPQGPPRPGAHPVPPAPAGWAPAGQYTAGMPPYGQQPPGWASGWAIPEAPKPGVIPLRPLRVGDILEGSIATIRRYPAQMFLPALAIALISYVPLVLLGVVVLGGDGMEALTSPDQPTADEAVQVLLVLGLLGLSWGLVLLLSNSLVSGILTVVVSRGVLGKDVTLGELWERVRPRALRLVATTVLVGLAVGVPWVAAGAVITIGVALEAAFLVAIGVLGLLAAGALSGWIAVRLALSLPATALESDHAGRPISPTLAMGRSWLLVRGSWWRTLGVLLLAAVLASAISAVINIPASIASAGTGAAVADPAGSIIWWSLLSVLGGVVGQTVTAPLVASIIALTYIDRRIRTEDLASGLIRAAGASEQSAAEPPAQSAQRQAEPPQDHVGGSPAQ